MFSYNIIRNLNDLEILIYNYVVSNPQDVVHMTIRELAGKLNVSSTSILRFCSKVGCDGYSEFKYRLKESLEARERIGSSADIAMIQDFFNKAEKNELDAEMEKAAQLIYSSRSFYH